MPETQIDAVAREKLTDVFAVVSEVQTADGSQQYRRKVHLSLTAAQKAVQRAHERGLEATVVMCRMEPVEGREEDAWIRGIRPTT